MARKFTAEELIEYVRRKTAVDDPEVLGMTTTDLLNILNEELLGTIVPVVRRTREEYFVVTRRVPIVAGTTRYRIPERSIGQQLRNVFFYNGTTRSRMVLIDPTQLAEQGTSVASTPEWFWIEGNHLCLPDNLSTTGSLEISYLARPGQLILASNARLVASVDTASKIINLTAAMPADWESTVTAFDVHSPHSGGELKQISLTKVSGSTTVLEVSEAIDGSVFGTYQPEPGDYVCPAGEAALPGVPIELHIVLGQAASLRLLEQLGEIEAAAAAKQTLGEMIQNEISLFENRVESHPKKIVSRNPLWGGNSYIGRGAWW